jgi:hypothetical protein
MFKKMLHNGIANVTLWRVRKGVIRNLSYYPGIYPEILKMRPIKF